MRSFNNFIFEARSTEASKQAKAKGLAYDAAKSGWVDRQGNLVARTEAGQLVFTPGRGPAKEEEPSGRRPAMRQDLVKKKEGGEEEVEVTKDTEEVESDGKEKSSEDVTIVFGRFNPPTVGHKKLLDGASKIAGENGDLRIYPSRSHDPKKNPLDPGQKVDVMGKMFPEYKDDIVNDEDVKTIFDALALADKEGYGKVQIVVGSDRVSEFDSLAQKYNGDLYDFDEIEVISAGDRDADSDGVEGMSASKMRKAAGDNDFEAFAKGIPDSMDEKAKKTLFNTLRKSMNVKEGWNLWEIAPKFDWRNLRENYVRGNIFKMHDLVENLNTGLVGKIIRRGTNYLICVTEDDIMFKSWIKDIKEYTEVHMARKERVPGKPNTLVGTTGYFRNQADNTPEFNNPRLAKNLQAGGKPYKGPVKTAKESFSIMAFLNKYRKK
jgi:hypothetical protein